MGEKSQVEALRAAIEAVVIGQSFGKPTAVKRGRRREWPHVPVIDHGAYTEQLRAKAYAVRGNAIAYAKKTIEARRESFRSKLLNSDFRALREQHGLPRELPKAIALAERGA